MARYNNKRILKFEELTKNLKETVEKAKKELLDAIMNDKELSKPEKLELIDDNNLFGTSSSIEDIFSQYRDEFKKTQKLSNPTIDDFFVLKEVDRHSMVNLSNELEYINWNYTDDDMITIFRDRKSGKEFRISRYEFIDTVYDWCIKHQKIGFEYDW